MEPQEIETNFRPAYTPGGNLQVVLSQAPLILQICEKNTTDIHKLIANQDKLTLHIDRLAQIQLA